MMEQIFSYKSNFIDATKIYLSSFTSKSKVVLIEYLYKQLFNVDKKNKDDHKGCLNLELGYSYFLFYFRIYKNQLS